MFNFKNDYSTLATKEILEALSNAKDEVNLCYGDDIHQQKAKKLIKDKFALDDGSSIYFVSGGTQANMLVISFLLRPYEAVFCADTGHINVHETGAVENTGHKIITCLNENGKLTDKDILEALNNHQDNHKVEIKMVYISMSTECGTIYTIKELEKIKKVCISHNLYLFIDGARLATGITSKYGDLSLDKIKDYADVFYIGGTKGGLLFGEAIVFTKKGMDDHFNYYIKQKGALLAKGFVLGIQFERLFEDDLYLNIGKHSNNLAYYISENLKKMGVKLQYKTYTNQIFVSLNKDIASKVISRYGTELWETHDDKMVIRIVTSYMVSKDECDELLNYIKKEIS